MGTRSSSPSSGALSDLPSERLLARAAERDERAFAALYRRYGGPAFAVAYRILRDRELAQDAVQEAFLALWRSAGRFERERGSARSLILTLVHRRAVDRVRREERRRAEPLNGAAEHGASDEAPADSFERDRVRTALRRLPRTYRQAIELAYYDGLPQEEIASRLRIPLGTIKSRTARGLFRLGELLREAEKGHETVPAAVRLAEVRDA